jgi:protein-L-isoaspartate(D-aspartate) O-methyltransferase
MPGETKRRVLRVTIAAALAAIAPARLAATATGDDASYREARTRMVDAVARMARDTARDTGRPAFAPAVMSAMGRVPRHEFVPPGLVRRAYENAPLPIGQGQTISQPFIVALSTDLIEPKSADVVLEVGTGSGYQAAVLAELVQRVYSIEIVESLGREAERRLAAAGYRNVTVRIGDGYAGWPERAPFDAIVVTAGAPHVPEPLVAQLKPGGRMVIPVDAGASGQDLVLIRKGADGAVSRRVVLPVRFVPLTGPGVREGARTR